MKSLTINCGGCSINQRRGHLSFEAVPYWRAPISQVLWLGTHKRWILCALDCRSGTWTNLLLLRYSRIIKVNIIPNHTSPNQLFLDDPLNVAIIVDDLELCHHVDPPIFLLMVTFTRFLDHKPVCIPSKAGNSFFLFLMPTHYSLFFVAL